MQNQKLEPLAEQAAVNKISEAIEQALNVATVTEVLSVLTGSFVGLTAELVRRQGYDADKEIKVDGGAQRDITIHARKTPSRARIGLDGSRPRRHFH